MIEQPRISKSSDKMLLVPIMLLCMTVMISDYKVICNIIGSVCSSFMILYVYIKGGISFSGLEKKSIKYILFFLLYYTITSLFAFNFNYWITYLLYYIILFTPFLLCKYVTTNFSKKTLKFIVFIFFVVWTAFCLICLKSCIDYPALAREMTANRKMFEYVINGGGYYMGYGSAVLSVYLFERLINGHISNLFYRLYSLGLIALMIVLIFYINSYVIFVATSLGFGVCIVGKISRNTGARVISYLIIGILALILYLNVSNILTFMIDNTKDPFWNKRFTETYEAIVLKQNSNHVDSREEVYQISIDGIKQSPIFGVGYKYGNVFDHDSTHGVGNHSSILDTLAQYGIIGGLPLFLFLFYPWRKNSLLHNPRYYLIPFYAMLYLNPIFTCYHTMFLVYLLIPILQNLSPKYASIPLRDY